MVDPLVLLYATIHALQHPGYGGDTIAKEVTRLGPDMPWMTRYALCSHIDTALQHGVEHEELWRAAHHAVKAIQYGERRRSKGR